MDINIGKSDKIIRVLLGSIVIILGAQLNGVWGVFGIIPIITVQVGICPLYLLLGINTVTKDALINKK
jgi:hypothetical protein